MEPQRLKAERYTLYRSSVHVLLFDEEGVEISCLVGQAIGLIQDYVLSHRQVYFQHGIFAITFVPALAADSPLPDDPDKRMDLLVNDEQVSGETDIPSMGNVGLELTNAFSDWRAANDEWRASIADLPDVWWPVPGALFNGVDHDDSNLTAWYLSDDCIEMVASTPDLYRLVEIPLLVVASESTFLPREIHVIERSVVHRSSRPSRQLPSGK